MGTKDFQTNPLGNHLISGTHCTIISAEKEAGSRGNTSKRERNSKEMKMKEIKEGKKPGKKTACPLWSILMFCLTFETVGQTPHQ